MTHQNVDTLLFIIVRRIAHNVPFHAGDELIELASKAFLALLEHAGHV